MCMCFKVIFLKGVNGWIWLLVWVVGFGGVVILDEVVLGIGYVLLVFDFCEVVVVVYVLFIY